MKWIVVSLVYGVIPINDLGPIFNTQTACEIYRHNVFGEEFSKALKLTCKDVGPLQTKPM